MKNNQAIFVEAIKDIVSKLGQESQQCFKDICNAEEVINPSAVAKLKEELQEFVEDFSQVMQHRELATLLLRGISVSFA